MPLLQLTDDELDCCAAFLDLPSAVCFSETSKACYELVIEQLAAAKVEAAAAKAAAAAAAAANAPPPRLINWTDAARAFIDGYLDEYAIASPSERGLLVESIRTAAAAHEELDSANWRPQHVTYRLSNALKARNRRNRAA